MDLHTLVSRIQDLMLEVEISAYSIPEEGRHWLAISAFDTCRPYRHFGVAFNLKDGAPVDADVEIEDRLAKISTKVKEYDEMDRERTSA
jgi:hypothetical protein